MKIEDRIKLYDIVTLTMTIPATYVLNKGNLPKDQKDLITLLMYASLTMIPALHYGYTESNKEKVKKFRNGLEIIRSKGNFENI